MANQVNMLKATYTAVMYTMTHSGLINHGTASLGVAPVVDRLLAGCE